MPELPEVETIRRDLIDRILGCKINTVRVDDPLVVIGDAAAFAHALTGRCIASIDRLGKALIFSLDTGIVLVVHLRMTGQLYPVTAGELPDHARVVLSLDDGRELVYRDTRRLGRLEIASSPAQATILANLGRDALQDPPSADELAALLSRRSTPIKAFLLDQRYLSGIGNIYAAEILHRCGIHPQEPCQNLTAADISRLLEVSRQVLIEAIGERGTTISNYVTGTGKTGGFQYHLRVYRREGEPCEREGCPGHIRRMVQSGRSTFYCPHCQRRKRR